MISPDIRPLVLSSTSANDALIVIDMQNDFLPGGALAVEGGDSVIAGINMLGRRFEHIILTQDWHPWRHISFASSHGMRSFIDTVTTPFGIQRLWPDHCVQGSRGAELSSQLDLPNAELVLRKGFRREIDSYSAFVENDGATRTGLAGYLHERGLSRLFFTGLAYDLCVGFSALEAVSLGFETIVVEDLSKAIDVKNGVQSMNEAFDTAGVKHVLSAELLVS